MTPEHSRHNSGHQRHLHRAGKQHRTTSCSTSGRICPSARLDDDRPSTQVSSSGVNSLSPVDFINKTGVSVADSDGNDTLDPQFRQWQSAAGHRPDVQRRNGHQSVQVIGGGNYTLGANATITNTTVGGGGLSLINEQNVSVTGTTCDQYFTVTNWLSTPANLSRSPSTAVGGHDQVYVRQNANFSVNGSQVTTDAELT